MYTAEMCVCRGGQRVRVFGVAAGLLALFSCGRAPAEGSSTYMWRDSQGDFVARVVLREGRVQHLAVPKGWDLLDAKVEGDRLLVRFEEMNPMEPRAVRARRAEFMLVGGGSEMQLWTDGVPVPERVPVTRSDK